MTAIETQVKEKEAEFSNAVLLTSMDIRRYLRRLIDSKLPTLPVLSHQEVTPEISLQLPGRIQL